MKCTRRQFSALVAGTLAAAPLAEAANKPAAKISLAGEVGITTSSFSGHLFKDAKQGGFTLLELPRILRDELDMRVIDLNTSSLASEKPAYLDRCREAAEAAGCVFSNLKMNQRNLDMNHPNPDVREVAIRAYQRSIGTAARLGAQWARPLPLAARPDMKIHVDSYRRLAQFAEARQVTMLVENFGWMQDNPRSILELVAAIGKGPMGRTVKACPDTGNWDSNEIRYRALELSFPGAVTCDFKARELGPNGEHPKYDLRRCFEIGRKAGFNGPWCLEHAHRDRQTLFKDLAWLRDQLRKWMVETQQG